MNNHGRTSVNRRRIKASHVLIGLLLVVLGAFAIFRLNTKFKLRARVDAIRAAGYPATCAELDQWYKLPRDVENAAFTLEEAFLYLSRWDKGEAASLPLVGRAELPPRTESLPAEMSSLMADYVADNNEALELLHAGAAVENCRYTVDLSLGLGALMPYLSEMRRSVQLLELEAVLHADAGETESAKRSAISCFGIANSLEGQPVTVAQLVRVACLGAAVATVEQIVNRTELTDGQLVELVHRVQDSECIAGMSCALVGERCMGLSFFQAPETIGLSGGGMPAGPVLAVYKALGLADADAVIYLDLMEQYKQSLELPMHQRQDAAKVVDAKLQSTSKARVLLHEIMPAFSRIIVLEMRATAHLRAADAGLAVERYRLAAHKLPDKLADLVPAYLESVPTDPFDGNDLRYKKLDPGFVVYSIGEDLSDDGGKEKPSKTTRGGKPVKWDVTFIIER